MRWTSALLTGFACLASANPVRHQRNLKRGISYKPDAERAGAVKDAFQRGWDGYYKYAFPHDSLKPVTNGWADDRNGWGASAIDAFSTAVVMGNEEVVQQILEYVPEIGFNTTADEVSLFETTIRYLGGLLSAYDLLTSPSSDSLTKNETLVRSILEQATHLADQLKFGFNTPTGIPDNTLYFNPPRIRNSSSNGIATIGTLVLEWTRLSDLTGNREYAELAQKAEAYLLDPQPAELAEPFPGLIGTDVDIRTGKFLNGRGGWVGGDDSFYEYLIKMYLYDPVRFAHYKDRWVLAANSSIEHLVSHPTTRPELTFLAMFNNQSLELKSQHLACFDGGNFILGGLTLDEPRYVNFGLELTEACRATYTATATHLGPETFVWQDSRLDPTAPNNPGPPAEQADFYREAGFWIQSSDYVLRPEVIESYYYAYRATGDAKYQEWSWEAFVAINATTSVGSGFSSVTDVNKPGGGSFSDFQESFLFAEVMKYAYLIHAEDEDWQIKADHSNKFVYNTECHPIAIPGGERQRY